MHPFRFLSSVLVALSFVWAPGYGAEASSEPGYPNPGRYENQISAFETADKENPPPKGAVLCIGSSSMRGWHMTLREDLSPITVIPRGFGGSNLNDVIHFADRVVLPYEPRAIVLYEGDNDIAAGISPERYLKKFNEFTALVHSELPECRIYVLATKPSISRWKLWPKMERANQLVAAACEQDERLTYVDVASGMLNAEGTPRKELLKKDNLHMTREGYILWRDVLRPVLLKNEGEFDLTP
ncbi:MAG: SGNH/GDSL hydrolase family protein [Kiritimatiellae bacterium]|jgi:lysophospholipase L1-like esterase|nr:SGNH/GDSL hydrolase family protein [Kiritimatiellia bacterium]